ncbi:MAG TPA: glycosyltransferase family 4 protein [Thermoanaerobaculia bacterium]|nr:glycosyltransferase family 4 protein [Thermoanaerobaculia bacterium]
MKIALVANRWPWPPRRGDQLRASQLAGFLDHEYELTVLAPLPPRGEAPWAGPTSAELVPFEIGVWDRVYGLANAALTGKPLESGLLRSRRLLDLIEMVNPDLVILQLARLAPWITRRLEGVPLIVDFVDSLSLNFERRARLDKGWKRPLLKLEAKRLARAERDLVAASAASVVVAARDRDFIARALDRKLASRLAVIPLAIDLSNIAPSDRQAGAGVNFVVTGSLGYYPTAEGLRWWLRDVWPPVRRALPEARLTIAGSRAGRGLSALIARAGAELVADPESLDGILGTATASLVPLRAGSGSPIKVLEAWRAGAPVVSTTWGAAGVEGRRGEDLLIADEPGAWVEALVALSQDRGLRERLARGGLERLQRDYAAQTVAAEWRRLISSVGAQSAILAAKP